MKTIKLTTEDRIDTIAAREGVTVEQIWCANDNKEIRALRLYPHHLQSGDTLVIPDRVAKTVDVGTQGAQEQGGKPHDLVVCQPENTLRIRLLVNGVPCVGAVWRLSQDHAVTTGAMGEAEFELYPGIKPFMWTVKIPAEYIPYRPPGDVGMGALEPWTSEREQAMPFRQLHFEVGPPKNELAALQARLTNLGFHCEPDHGKSLESGRLHPLTRAAFLRFRRAFGLDRNDAVRGPPFHTFDEIQRNGSRELAELLRLHETDENWRHPYTDEDMLCRRTDFDGRNPIWGGGEGPLVYRLSGGPRWCRINLLEGPEVIVDGHMHIMSGKCSPLPLAWDKVPGLNKLKPARSAFAKLDPVIVYLSGWKQFYHLRERAKKKAKLFVALNSRGRITDETLKAIILAVAQTIVLAGYGSARERGVNSDRASTARALGILRKMEPLAGAPSARAPAKSLEQALRNDLRKEPERAREIANCAISLAARAVKEVFAVTLGCDSRERDHRTPITIDGSDWATDAPSRKEALHQPEATQADLAALEKRLASELLRLAPDPKAGTLANADAHSIVGYICVSLKVANERYKEHLEAEARAADASTGADQYWVNNKRRLLRMGNEDTSTIARRAVKGNDEAGKNAPVAARGGRLSTMVALSMDMDFGHLEGYHGAQIYTPTVIEPWLQISMQPVDDPHKPPTKMKLRKLPPGTAAGPHPVPFDYDVPYYRTGGPPRPGEPVRATMRVPPDSAPGPQVTVRAEVIHVHLAPDQAHYAGVQYMDPELNVDRFWMDDEEFELFQPYPTQVEDTIKAAAAHPWRLLPLYHYDPRRWNLAGTAVPEKSQWYRGKEFQTFPQSWKTPFDRYFQHHGPRPFLGFKQYTALGYRPLDWRLDHQRDFYEACVAGSADVSSTTALDIPLVCHCSSGGQYTVERPFYVVAEEKEAKRRGRPFSLKDEKRATLDLMRRRGVTENLEDEWPVHWYSEKYISPFAWREVLLQFPKLRLSLAHFGGDPPYARWYDDAPPFRENLLELPWEVGADLSWDDAIIKLAHEYANFHVDISYFIFNGLQKERFERMLELYPHMRRRILFGTDWWMVEQAGYGYPEYVKNAKEYLDRIDPELWQRFTWINPVRFYRLKENAKAIASALYSVPPRDKEQTAAWRAEIATGQALLEALQIGETHHE